MFVKIFYTEVWLLVPCLHWGCWFWLFNSSPATRKNAVCLKNIKIGIKCNEIWTQKRENRVLQDVKYIWEKVLSQKILYLKKFIILTFESASISVVPSNACCMWCNHLSAARCVTGNGRWRAIRAGWPAKHLNPNIKLVQRIQI